jgi:hypothetical protein
MGNKKEKETKQAGKATDTSSFRSGAEVQLDSKLLGLVNGIAISGLTPTSALDLLGKLLAEVPRAASDRMELIKMTDSLIKTSRSMMETKLKHDDAEAIMQRLDEIETQMDELAASKDHVDNPVEAWNSSPTDE